VFGQAGGGRHWRWRPPPSPGRPRAAGTPRP
jgi:hypothetical protein